MPHLAAEGTVHIAQQCITSQHEVLYTSHSSKILSEGDTVHTAQQYISLQQEELGTLYTSHPRSRRYCISRTAVKILSSGGTVHLAHQWMSSRQEVPYPSYSRTCSRSKYRKHRTAVQIHSKHSYIRMYYTHRTGYYPPGSTYSHFTHHKEVNILKIRYPIFN